MASPQRRFASLLESLLEIPLPSTELHALVEHFGGSRALLGARRAELVAAGLAPVAARRLVASRRLARLLVERERSRKKVVSARCVATLLPHLSWCPIEEVWVVAVDARRHVLTTRLVGRGDVGRCQVEPAEIFGVVLRVRASSFYLVHNHPSGSPAPSFQDVDLTERLRDLGRALGVPLDDHVIIAGDRYESLIDRKRGPIGGQRARPRL